MNVFKNFKHINMFFKKVNDVEVNQVGNGKGYIQSAQKIDSSKQLFNNITGLNLKDNVKQVSQFDFNMSNQTAENTKSNFFSLFDDINMEQDFKFNLDKQSASNESHQNFKKFDFF